MPTSFSLFYDPLGIPVGDGVPQGVEGFDGCELQYEDATYLFENGWSTANQSIATVNANGMHTGMGVGPTTTLVTSEPIEVQIPHNTHCFLEQRSVSGDDNTKPNITSISPSRGLIAATTSSITISGKGFQGGHINTPAALVVTNIRSYTDTQIVMDLAIASTADPGKNAEAISITASGMESNKVDFFVQLPTSLTIVPGSARNTDEKQCTSNACGTVVQFTYQVLDQDSTPQPIANTMSIWDSFGTFNPDVLGFQGAPLTTTCTASGQTNGGPCGVNTASDGTLGELALGGCSTVCYVNNACTTGGPSSVTQTWHVAGNNIAQNVSEYCEKVNVNGVRIQ